MNESPTDVPHDAGDDTESLDPVEVYPLTWSQRSIWLDHENTPVERRGEHNQLFVRRLPAGSDEATCRDVVEFLVAAHDTFRTLIRYDRDTAVRQFVLTAREARRRGLILHRVHRAGRSPEPLEALTEGLREHSFDLSRELPLLALASEAEGRWTLHLLIHHVAIDREGLRLLRKSVDRVSARLVAAPGSSYDPEPDGQTARQATYECSPAGAGRQVEANSRLVRLLSEPGTNYPWTAPGVLGVDDTKEVALTSGTLAGQVRALARSRGVFPSAIYLAAFSAVLKAYGGSPSVTVKALISNRFGKEQRDAMGCRFIPSLSVVGSRRQDDLTTMYEEAAASLLSAAKSAYSGYDEGLECMARISQERGVPISPHTFFNYLLYTSEDDEFSFGADGISTSPEPEFSQDEELAVRVRDSADRAEFALIAHERLLEEAELRVLVQAVSDVVAAGEDFTHVGLVLDTLRTGSPRRIDTSTDWVLMHGSWLNVRSILDHLRSCPGVASVEGRVEGPDRGPLLEVQVEVHDERVTADHLRASIRTHMYDVPGLRCPDVLSVTRASGSTGRPGSAVVPRVDERKRAVFDAQVQGLLDPGASLEDCWVVAGGRYLDIPQVRRRLLDAGWEAPAVHYIGSARPLRAVVDALRPAPRP